MPTLHIQFENGDVHQIRAEGYVTVRELMHEYLRAKNVLTGDEKGGDWTTLHKRTNMALELDRTLDQHGLKDGDELYISRRGNRGEGADLKLDVTSPDGKNHHAEMPPDTATEELLTDLIEVWKLPAGSWELVDQQTGKRLDSKKTLAENGVVTGQRLYLKQPGPGVKPGNPCWRCQADVRGMRYCNKCGADQQQGPGFKAEVVEPEGKRREIEISSYNEKTQGIFRKKLGLDPVVGWLVCVDGSERGRDYPIRGENNFIGRSEKMDICIGGDDGISRENHAVISFDLRTSLFKLSRGDARGMVYLNGEAVYSPVDLSAHDQIQLGNSQFRFIPLCGDQFQWT